MKNKFIHKVWEEKAKAHTSKPEVSWGDKYMISLEIEAISKEIFGNKSVLDVGCANGHATLRQAERSDIKKMRGIDFSEEMIKNAKKSNSKKGIKYSVGDVKKIKFPDNKFDAVYTTRTLINLPTWEEQIQGIRECLRVCKPGGKVILCEAFYEPLTRLNSVRLTLGLKPLIEHDFNRYLKIKKLNDFLLSEGIKFCRHDISSMYYFGSRVLRELFTDGNKYSGYAYHLNDVFYSLERSHKPKHPGHSVGIQQKYVIYKDHK